MLSGVEGEISGHDSVLRAVQEQQQMEVRELIEEIVKALVDNPDQVQCVEIQGTQSCVLSYMLPPVMSEKSSESAGCTPMQSDDWSTRIGGKRKRRYVLEIIEDQ